MSKFAAFALLFCLVSSSWALSCLSYPGGNSRGRACFNDLGCRNDNDYCSSKEGVCLPSLKIGSDCTEIFRDYGDNPCERGSQCVGRDFTYKCVASVHPGKDCGTGSAPRCGTGSCIENICRGGNIGDTCRVKDDCLGEMTCVDNSCVGINVGSVCTMNSECIIGAYCNSESGLCASQKTQGVCQSGNECAVGFDCLATNITRSLRNCVAYESLAPGDFCDNNGRYCKDSLRCSNGYCAANKIKFCNLRQCSADQYCSCNGDRIIEGVGTCTTDSCYKSENTFGECWKAKCKSTSYFIGSCVEKNCKSSYLKTRNC